MGNFTKFETGTELPNLSMGRNVFVPAQLDIEANIIAKVHSNPPSSFWGNVITRKIKAGQRRPYLSTDRTFISVLVQLDMQGNILYKFKKIHPMDLEE